MKFMKMNEFELQIWRQCQVMHLIHKYIFILKYPLNVAHSNTRMSQIDVDFDPGPESEVTLDDFKAHLIDKTYLCDHRNGAANDGTLVLTTIRINTWSQTSRPILNTTNWFEIRFIDQFLLPLTCWGLQKPIDALCHSIQSSVQPFSATLRGNLPTTTAVVQTTWRKANTCQKTRTT